MERDFASFKHNEEIIKTFNSLRHFTGYNKKGRNEICLGTTYIGSALEMVLLQLETRRKSVPTIVIVLSDGYFTNKSARNLIAFPMMLYVNLPRT